jgi:uncharacterized protein
MSRVLFFVLLAIVVYMLVRSMKRRSGRSAPSPGPATPEVMVSCATCGLHLPRGEALLLGDRYFCCEEHRRRPPAA